MSRLTPLLLLLLLGLGAALPAQSGACLSAGDNPTFDSRIRNAGLNLRIGIRETTGARPLTIHALQVFTGAIVGNDTLGIWSHDAVNDRPLADLSTGTFLMTPLAAWQGVNLPAPVTIPANTTFWIVWRPQNGSLGSVERLNPNAAGQTYRRSFDGGQSWDGPFNDYDWKYRVWCLPLVAPGWDVFGSACPRGPVLQPMIGLSALPQLGTTIDLIVNYREPRAAHGPAFSGLGLSDRVWGGTVPLPFDLGPFGAPGCAVHIDLLTVVATSLDGSGAAQHRLAVPTQTSALGLQLFAQWIIPDAAANSLGLVFSPGGRMTIGI